MKNFQAPENKVKCKGEARLLATRINECEAAGTILDSAANPPKVERDEMMKALQIIEASWHHLKPSLKAKLAKMDISHRIQEYGASGESDPNLCHVLVADILPAGPAESFFDGAAPSFHAAWSELHYLISTKFDDHEMDVEDDERFTEYKVMAKARVGDFGPFVLLASFLYS